MRQACCLGGGLPRPSSGRTGRGPLSTSALLVVVLLAACGKKGPPQPPFVRLPAAPADFVAERRGDLVEVSFTVPWTNTDGTRPADLERVDVYGFTGPRAFTDAEILRWGTLVASVSVKSPRDPDQTIDADEPSADLEPLQGSGLDQGATARLTEQLTDTAFRRVELPVADRGLPIRAAVPFLLYPENPSRTYVAIGVSTRGRRGAISSRTEVSLARTPIAPAAPLVTYDEQGVTISWQLDDGESLDRAGDVLPSRPLWPPAPETAFNIYEIEPVASGFGAGTPSAATRLTPEPLRASPFVDPRIQWNVERCYTVRLVRRLNGLAVESEDSTPTCLVIADVFPPPVPTRLRAIASEGAITLIWDPVSAPDLSGYVVLRGTPGQMLQPVAAAPIQESTFRDEVPAGTRYVYAVQAVDMTGNASEPSERDEATAR